MNCTAQMPEHSATAPGRIPEAYCVADVVADVVAADIVPADVLGYFNTLSDTLGPMHWWPARTPFEVIVGAILTQNTAWSNVERALINLRREGWLTPRAIERVS